MLKKQDLVDRFEVLTKQEIKNHNDQILASNLSINKLREDISSWNKSLDMSTLSSKNYTDEISEALTKKLGYLSTEIDIIHSRNDKERDSIKLVISDILDKLKKKLDSEISAKEIATLRDILSSVQKHFSKKIDMTIGSFRECLLDLSKSTLEKIGTLDDKLFKQAESFSKVKKELESKLDIVKLERDSVLKEINILKKESFITEKKIENLYTLIDRLKKP